MAKMSNRGMTKKFLITEMDRSIKRMLKLIEEEGDSFAKKAEIYLRKRPVLVAQVEDFYRMFRSLAERYENATAELRRLSSTPSDLRSQCSSIGDAFSEPPSRMPSPEHRLTRRLSAPKPAIFEIMASKEADETSVTMDSDSESDSDSSVYNYSSASTYGNYRRLRKKIAELEDELRRIKIQQGEMCRSHEEELRLAKEKIRSSEEEINRLMIKLQNYESGDFDHESSQQSIRIQTLEEDVKRLSEELYLNCRVHKQFESEKTEWNADVEDYKQYISNLQFQISRYKVTLSDRDQQIATLKHIMTNLVVEQALGQGIRELENEYEVGAKGDEIERLKEERDEALEKVSGLEEEVGLKDDQIEHMNERLCRLALECENSSKATEELGRRSRELEKAIEKQRAVMEEEGEENRQTVRQLWITLEHYRNAYHMLRQDLLEQKKPVKHLN